MKTLKLTISLITIGIFTVSMALAQGSQPHVPFSELDPSKGYADEAEYIKAHQEMNARAEGQADQNVKPADDHQKKNIKEGTPPMVIPLEDMVIKEDDGDAGNEQSDLEQLVIAYEQGGAEIESKITHLIKEGLLTRNILSSNKVATESKLYKRVDDQQKLSK
jgi:hypothetical protein